MPPTNVACTGAVREVREMEGKLAEKHVRVLYKPFGANDLERQAKEALEIST